MRGRDQSQMTMLSLKTPGDMVPAEHPLRRLKPLADAALARLSPVFDALYEKTGRESIPPERLLKGMLLIALYSVRSERLFCEQLSYNLLYRWFLDMNMVETPFDHSTFSANRERLLQHDVAALFFQEVVNEARGLGLMSSEHFTVDGTLIEAWASLKSFKKKDGSDTKPPDDPGNPTVNFHGEKRSNATHESTTDSEARLAKRGKGKEAKLSYSGHALMENRNGLLADLRIEEANGRAEVDAGLAMLNEVPAASRITVGGDKGYDIARFVSGCRDRGVTPHVAQNLNRSGGSAIDGRTSSHLGYVVSQWIRKRVEEIFGWMKTVGGFRRTRFRGREKTQMAAYMVGAAYNLLRIAKLTAT